MRRSYRAAVLTLISATLLYAHPALSQPGSTGDQFAEIYELAAKGKIKEARAAIDAWEAKHPEDRAEVEFARQLTEKAAAVKNPKQREMVVAVEVMQRMKGAMEEVSADLGAFDKAAAADRSGAVEALVASGDVEGVRSEIEAGYSVADHKGMMPLLNLAVAAGKNDMMKLLVENGAPVDSENLGGTPLMTAAEKGNLEAVKFLLEHGADVNKADLGNRTALNLAEKKKHVEIAEYLRERGGAANTPKPIPERMPKKKEALSPNEALLDAAFKGSLDKARDLIAKGADVNHTGSTGFRPLSAAVSKGNVSMTKLLLSQGAEPNFEAKGLLSSPLLLASHNGAEEIVTLLLENGANPNRSGSLGLTPLMLASSGGHAETVKRLLSKGAKIDALSTVGQTALIHAAKKGKLPVVKLLLSKKAKVNVRDAGSKTALDYALEGKHTKVAEALKAAGAKKGS